MKIGLTQTESLEKHQFYIDWLKAHDAVKEVVTLSVEKNNVQEFVECDGLVLSGGVDVHPELYKGKQDYANLPSKRWRKERDKFETGLLSVALLHQMPMLGICRGMQLINVVFNGTLVQDLGQGNEVHKGQPDKKHTIKIEHNSWLYEMTRLESGQVNSAHHQAIDVIGSGLMINCHSEDGTPEGIEWSDKYRYKKPFLIGVQWHPERMHLFGLQDTPLATAVRNRFIEEVRKAKAVKA